jgi:uncharacterized protein (DUF433 family)
MATLQATQELLSTLTRAEKAQLLQWIVCDLGDVFPGIETTPGVAGGEPCIVRTRIPIWVLEQARRLGVSEADLLRAYPSLRAEDLPAPGRTSAPIATKSTSKSAKTRTLEPWRNSTRMKTSRHLTN